MDTATAQGDDERQLGLNYARSINFTEEQYQEALKKVSSPADANQLLVALIDVCNLEQNKRQELNDDTSQVKEKICKPNSTSSSAVSSCHSSIKRLTSTGSSSNQSLECLGQQQSAISSSQPDLMHAPSATDDLLKPIFIDGSNVART